MFFGQPVVLMVSGRFEQARAAGGLVDIACAPEPGAYDFATHRDRADLPATLRILPDRVQADAALVGGGFGSTLRLHERTVFAALAARQIGRPVKAAQTPRQAFAITGRRIEMIHRLRLAADADGGLAGGRS